MSKLYTIDDQDGQIRAQLKDIQKKLKLTNRKEALLFLLFRYRYYIDNNFERQRGDFTEIPRISTEDQLPEDL